MHHKARHISMGAFLWAMGPIEDTGEPTMTEPMELIMGLRREHMENKIYPLTEQGQKPPFYVEFERGDRKGEFTLFRRQFFHTEEELVELEKKSEDAKWLRISNEVHPWNIFTAEYGADGCVPDRKWVEWMVDALNLAVEFQASGKKLAAKSNF